MYQRHNYHSLWFIAGVLMVVVVAFLLIVNRQQTVLPVDLNFLGQTVTIEPEQRRVLGEYTYQATAGATVTEPLGMVYGFLPYWNVANYTVPEVVSHVAYFRLAVDGAGEIITEEDDGGYQVYNGENLATIKDEIERQRTKLEVTIFSSQYEVIEQLLACENCRLNLISNIDQVIEANQLDGINLDFEYVGSVSDEARAGFTDFVYRLANMMQSKYPRAQLSIDVYGGAGNMNNIWDFPKLAKMVDRVIVMGYDYKTRRSSVPGPTSPTLGESTWGGDIWGDIQSLMRYVDSDKIILAIPFYGYAWETTSTDLETAKTYPGTGEAMTYRGAKSILEDETLAAQDLWDEESLTPYLTFVDAEGRSHIGFYENEKSIGYKIDLVEKLNLGGIAIWALGYEGEYTELWDVINERF